MEELKIDAEFEAKCPALTKEEFEQLEENIVTEGIVLTPIIVWGDTIIDGHNRWKILSRHPEIEYRIHKKEFENRYEAISWICKNQLGRRNLTPQQKKYLIGQRYEAEKEAENFHGNRFTSSRESSGYQNGTHYKEAGKTYDRIAKETNTSRNYVLRAAPYAKGIDAAEDAVPGVKKEFLSGRLKATDKEVTAIGLAPPEERASMVEAIQKANDNPPEKKKKEKSKTDKQQIDEIYQSMQTARTPVDDEEIIQIIARIGNNMVSTCESVFDSYSDFLKSPDNRSRAAAALQNAKFYIIKLEGETE